MLRLQDVGKPLIMHGSVIMEAVGVFIRAGAKITTGLGHG